MFSDYWSTNIEGKTFVAAAATMMLIQQCDYSGTVLWGICVDGAAGGMALLPSEGGGSSRGSAQTEVDDSPRFYLDSAADEVLGVGVQTDGDGPISAVQKPQRVRVRACRHVHVHDSCAVSSFNSRCCEPTWSH